MNVDHDWDSEELVCVAGDPPLRGTHRRLQSWYRATVLKVDAGIDPSSGKSRGNWLPDLGEGSTLNFLQRDDLTAIAEDRIKLGVGTVRPDRLRRNMLSSQPLCVNLFGPLQFVDLEEVAKALQPALHMDMSRISKPVIEWAPKPASAFLNDRTAFDAYVTYARDDGATGFVAVETKYTDSFSPDDAIRSSEAKRAKYRAAAAMTGEYNMDRVDELFHPKVSQLFRNALLTSLWRIAGGFDFGVCLVAALEADEDAVEAVDRMSAVAVNPSYLLRHRSHEELIEHLRQVPGLERWADEFTRRYLDLTHVT